MKFIKYILGLFLAITVQSCFQDFKEPAFNYPESKPDPDMNLYNPEKIKLTFDTGNFEDESIYQFQVSTYGAGSIIKDAGVQGAAYKGADESYILINSHDAIEEQMSDTLSNLKEFTLAIWLNSAKMTGATAIFSMSNSKTFWGNFDVFFENNNSETEAFIKTHLYNGDAEEWAEIRIPEFFNSGWQHLAITFNSNTSSYKIWHNGKAVFEKEVKAEGGLVFNNLSSIVVGAIQFQTIPSLTEGASKQDWAGYYQGMIDGLHFYTKELNKGDIEHLFLNKL